MPCIDVQHARQEPHEVPRRRMLEAHGAAEQPRPFAAAAVPEHFVALADLFAGEVEEVGRRHVRGAAQHVALAVGDEREGAGRQRARRLALHLEPAVSGGHDVEHQAVGHGRQVDAPGGAELGAGVDDAGHPQEVERLAERVARGPDVGAGCAGHGGGGLHPPTLGADPPEMRGDWTKEHE